jgi:hypothetical protein
MKSHSVISDENKSLMRRIKESKNFAKQALVLAYKLIEVKACKNYSITVDRIIELELQLGNPKKAELIALQRLNKKNPNWKNINAKTSASDLEALAIISNYKKSNSFYKDIKRNKGLYGICGTTSYEQDVEKLLWIADKLYNEHGKVYCLKFLQSSIMLLNEDNDRAKHNWGKIYELLIQSMTIEYSYKQIKNQFESSEVEQKELEEWEKLMWGYVFQESLYFLNIGGIEVYFKTVLCPNEQNKFLRCPPKNFDKLKNESKLYKKIKEYAVH